MRTIHSGLPIISAFQARRFEPFIVSMAGGNSPSSRLLWIDREKSRAFVRLDNPKCEAGPDCDLCQARVEYALVNGFKVFCTGKSDYVCLGGDAKYESNDYYAEIDYTPDVSVESLSRMRWPFPGKIVDARQP